MAGTNRQLFLRYFAFGNSSAALTRIRGRFRRTYPCGFEGPARGLRVRPAVSHFSRKTSEMPRISCTQLWTGPRVRLSLRKGAGSSGNSRNFTGNRGCGPPGDWCGDRGHGLATTFNPNTDNITYIPKNTRDSYVQDYFLSQRRIAKPIPQSCCASTPHGRLPAAFRNGYEEVYRHGPPPPGY